MVKIKRLKGEPRLRECIGDARLIRDPIRLNERAPRLTTEMAERGTALEVDAVTAPNWNAFEKDPLL